MSPLDAVQEIKDELKKFKVEDTESKLTLEKDFFKEFIKYIYQSTQVEGECKSFANSTMTFGSI